MLKISHCNPYRMVKKYMTCTAPKYGAPHMTHGHDIFIRIHSLVLAKSWPQIKFVPAIY